MEWSLNGLTSNQSLKGDTFDKTHVFLTPIDLQSKNYNVRLHFIST